MARRLIVAGAGRLQVPAALEPRPAARRMGGMVSEQPAAPEPRVRTWRPMLLWTAAIVAATGLAWFIGAVVVPVWQARRVLMHQPTFAGVERLGGKESALRKLVMYMRVPERWAPHKYEGTALLGACGPAAVPKLILLLRHREPGVREGAAETLGKMGDPRAIEPLGEAVKDRVVDVRIKAVLALGCFKSPQYIKPLTKALEAEDVSSMMAIAILSKMGAPAVEPLVGALANRRLCVLVIEALGCIGPDAKPAVPALENLLTDKDESVRTAAAEALKKLRGEETPK